MNVFVLSTGRCGSLSFERACSHITNFTASHESRCDLIGDNRLNFPDNHIEIDNRLAWILGRLDEKYGDNAIYVHLSRNREQTARSFMKRWNSETGILRAYVHGILKRPTGRTGDLQEVAGDYYDSVNSNIKQFLKDKSRVVKIDLETVNLGFEKFWNVIGANGNYERAVGEWSKKANSSSENAGKKSFISKVGRIVKKMPEFLKNA